MLDMSRIRPRQTAGYTLLEILFVLLLVGLVGALVVPRVGVIYDNLVLRSDREQLLRSIQLLPMEALARRVPIAAGVKKNSAIELLNPPRGWEVSFSEGLTYQANGFCTGGTVTLLHSSQRSWNYRLGAPFCMPEQQVDEG